MRIIAGQHRGLPLAAVGGGDTRAHLRPTSDRVRENLFNVLTGGRLGDRVSGARVLDLFAGTGALGLEALSRGAERVCFVENGRVGFRLISENIARLKAVETTMILTHDATTMVANPHNPFDLVFLDPPYGLGHGEKALRSCLLGGWLARDALIVWEENAPQIPPQGFALADARKYGDTHLTLLQTA